MLSLFADGHTVVLQGLHRLWPPLIDFAGALTSDLGHPVQINAYITPPSSQGFSAHYDVHDVFVLQVAGEKRWRIHAPVRPDPLRDEPWTDHRAAVEERAAEAPLIDAVLRPGDALYLPRGYLHAAEALGGTSCHLTVGVHPVTRQAVLDAVVAIVAGDPALRSSLPLGVDLSDAAQIEHDVQASVDAIVERLRTVSTADVAHRLAARAVRRPAPRPCDRWRRRARSSTSTATASSSVGRTCSTQSATRAPRSCSRCRTAPCGCPPARARRCAPSSAAPGCTCTSCPTSRSRMPLLLTRRLVREGVAVIEDASGAER